MSEQAAEQHAESASARVLALWAAYQAAQLSRPDAEAAMALALFTGKVLASRLADIAVSTIANLPPLGIAPGPRNVERLEEAVATVLDEHEDQNEDEPEEAAGHASERLSRLAMSETLNSHRASLHAAIRDHGFPSWQRVVAEDPCEVCAPLAGEIQSIDKGFKDHPGCRCSLIPHGKRGAASDTQTEPQRRVSISRVA